MCTVASAPAAFRVRVWHVMSRGRGREGVTAAGRPSCCLSGSGGRPLRPWEASLFIPPRYGDRSLPEGVDLEAALIAPCIRHIVC
jgi:hypothetical protein